MTAANRRVCQVDGRDFRLDARSLRDRRRRRQERVALARRLIWLLAPLAVLLVILALRSRDPSGNAGGEGAEPSFVLIRENGSRLLAPTHFAPGDRFNVLVSCSASTGTTHADVVISQDSILRYPLAPARISCGNQVPMPGAFYIDGPSPAVACLVLSESGPPLRQSIPSGSLCLELQPL